MSDLRVNELIEILKKLPQDGRVFYHSGEANGLLIVEPKNGKKQWSITRDGKIK